MAEIRIPDYIITQDATAPPAKIPYGVHMIGAEMEWPEVQEAIKQIKVAIVDTGAPQHPDIKLAGYQDVTGSGPYDRRGHGTHVAGTVAANGQIVGVAPGVQLYAVKAFQDTGGATSEWLTAALRWCRQNKMDIISMSLGGPSPQGPEFETELKACYAAGIVVIAAAGNFGRDFGVLYPARYPEVIAVAAVDISKSQGDFSAWGSELDVSAAGVDVWSTWMGGRYVQLSGTSMATPHITGAAAILQAKALIREKRKLTPAEMRLALRLYSEDIGDKGPDIRYGCGVFSFGRFTSPDTVRREVKMWIGRNNYLVNGQQKTMDVAPFIREGRTFTPARYVAEGLGAAVSWDDKEQKVTITGPGVGL